jgi:N-acetylmuramic acid 6-phosphate etherase
MSKWSQLTTEQTNNASDRIDEVSPVEMMRILNAEDAKVAAAVGQAIEPIAQSVELVSHALGNGGRLLYMGAGTSGRLGVLDASECPPTYNVEPNLVQGLIAGGPQAVFRSVEGAEDRPEDGESALRQQGLNDRDIVFGIAASGVTPYVLGGLSYARSLGCGTIFFTCSPQAAAAAPADIKIVAEVGPEAITGSTRMKAGTATKLVLNMVSTGAMVLQGKTYGNLMVDMRPLNAKLRDRSVRILVSLTALEKEAAQLKLDHYGGDLKLVLVMELTGLEAQEAAEHLAAHGGRVKQAVRAYQGSTPPV